MAAFTLLIGEYREPGFVQRTVCAGNYEEVMLGTRPAVRIEIGGERVSQRFLEREAWYTVAQAMSEAVGAVMAHRIRPTVVEHRL